MKKPIASVLNTLTSILLLPIATTAPLIVSAQAIAQEIPFETSESEALLRVEGLLEEGGATLPEDGTLYAEHQFEGQAGQTVTIVMESLEFDTYLLVRDSEGKIIAQNDDYAEGNFNSVIIITLPVDGIYTVVANAYDAQSRGQYTLTVLPGTEPIFSEVALRQVEARLLNQQGLQQEDLSNYQAALTFHEQAREIFREIGDRHGEGIVLNNIGVVYENLGEYERSLDYYQQALIIRIEVGDRTGEATTLNNIGAVHDSLGEYERSLDYYQQALSVFTEIGDRDGEGSTLNNIGVVYENLGEHERSLYYHQQALVIHTEIGDRTGEGIILSNIGVVYDSWGEYERSLDYYQQALSIFTEIGDRAGEGTTLNNIGLVYDSLGEYERSLDYYQQALSICTEIGNRAGEGIALNNIGAVYDSLGEYERSLGYYQQALSIRTEIGDRAGEGNTLNNIGGVYSRLNEYERALDYYQQALLIQTEIGNRDGQGTTLNNIGFAYNSLDEYEKALGYYQQALSIFTEIGNRSGEGTTLGNIGLVYDSLGEYERSLDYYQQALSIQTKIGDREGAGTTLNNIGLVYDSLGEYERSLDYSQQALSIFTEIGYRYGEGRTLNNIGEALEALEETELAIVFLKQSVNRWEAIRDDIRGLEIEQQQSFADSVSETYRKLADLLLQADRVLEAQRVLDLLKVQELEEYLQDVRGTAQTESGIELLNPEAEISNRAIAIGYELARLRAVPFAELSDDQKQRLAELSAEQDTAINDFQAFINSPEIQTLIAQLSSDAQEQDVLAEMDEFINLQNNLRALDQNAVMIYPLILENRLELVLVTPYSEPTRYPIDVERADLNEAIVAFRQALQNPTSDPKPIAQELYNWLIAPMADDLEAIGAETILYAPDGVLRYIPLAALHDGDRWLTERFRVNHITAASLQDFTLRPDPEPQILAAAFSQGLFEFTVGQRDFSLGGLPFAGVEVENLVAAFPSTTQFLNEAFSLADVELAMDSHTIVHLATHAAFVEGSPSDSFILFGNGDRLTLETIRENWQGKFNQVDLVVLSACETGVSAANLGNGEEILGFGYLMQQAGAEAAIASLWSVSDGGTQVLMDAFYAGLANGMTKAEALQQAQIALITGDFSAIEGDRGDGTIVFVNREGLPASVGNNLDHPYYWAPFILIGNGL